MELRQVIKMYLDCMANQDSEFATKYANPNKSLDDCILYIQHSIYEKAKDESKNSGSVCVAPSDDEVFALAVTYYQDEDLKVDGSSFDNVKIVSFAATNFTDEEKAQMRQDAIKQYQEDVIAEQRKKDEKRKSKDKKPTNPVLVPDVEEKPKIQQLSLF